MTVDVRAVPRDVAEMVATIDLVDLVDDGDTIELPDGTGLRLRIEPDDHSITDDGDWFGRIEWVRRNQYSDHSTRPEWANGAAEILERDRWSDLWWMPAADAVTDPTLRASLRREIREILETGYSAVGLEHIGPTCGQCQPWHQCRPTLATAWISGVATHHLWTRDNLRDYLSDLIPELT